MEVEYWIYLECGFAVEEFLTYHDFRRTQNVTKELDMVSFKDEQ